MLNKDLLGEALSEAAEPLDELRKATLANYISKASVDVAKKSTEKDSFKGVKKRVTGITKAAGKLAKEDVEELLDIVSEELGLDEEQLDELKKSTLQSYVKKAKPSMDKHFAAHDKHSDAEYVAHAITGNKAKEKYHGKLAGKHGDKGFNRQKGINNANAKLAKEEAEPLEELHKDTLKSYVKHASADRKDHRDAAKSSENDADHYEKLHNHRASDEKIRKIARDRGSEAEKAKEHHTDKADKRSKGISAAKKKIGEAFVPIAELRKATIEKYAEKASARATNHANATDKHASAVTRAKMNGDAAGAEQHASKVQHHLSRAMKYGRGVGKAQAKLSQEEVMNEELVELMLGTLAEEYEISEEQLDELKASTMKSYVKKAEKSSASHLRKSDDAEDKAMSTDGTKHPERQNKHTATAKTHFDKFVKREKGVANARHKLTKEDVDGLLDTVNEELGLDEEQLDELKKSTLASYIKKAAGESHDAQSDAGYHGVNAHRFTSADKKSSAAHKKAEKRTQGIDTAAEKLAKEEVEPLQELKKSTLARYVSKANDNMRVHAEKGGKSAGRSDVAFSKGDNLSAAAHGKDSEGSYSKASKRYKGISTAASKLAKEETELDEAQSAEVAAKVASDLAAHRERKAKLMADAKKELDAHTTEKKKVKSNDIYQRIKAKAKA